MMRKIAVVLLLALSGCAVPEPRLVPVKAEARFEGEYFEPSEVDIPVKVVKNSAPVYPVRLKQAGIGGYAIVELIVDANGAPSQAQCIDATDIAFAEATIGSMLRWRFVAARKAGVPVACRIVQRVEYNVGN